MEQDTLRGLSLLAWHIVTDIDGIQRELEGLADKPPRRSGRELKAALRKQAPEKSPDISGETVTK
jgi:hypothetical protein